MLPPAQKESQDNLIYGSALLLKSARRISAELKLGHYLIYAGFTLTQFRHSYIQIPQWRPVRLVSIPQLVDNRRAFSPFTRCSLFARRSGVL